MPQRLEARVSVGTSVLFFAAVNWMKVPPYLALGQFSAANLATSAALFSLALVATWLGVIPVRRFSNERFYLRLYADGADRREARLRWFRLTVRPLACRLIQLRREACRPSLAARSAVPRRLLRQDLG
jgi:hypothetical protein